MLIDGLSVQGSYHAINQDSYRYKQIDKGFIAALSDGLGSKKYSQFGSKAICESVVEVAENLHEQLLEIDPIEFIKTVHEKWKGKLTGYNIEDCYATMLVFVIYAGRGFAFRLGDGFLAFWADDAIRVLFDDKDDYFANETDCVTENLALEKIEMCEFEISELRGGVMCSDGVGIGNMTENELSDFTREFIEGYCDMNGQDITKDIFSWLSDWPGADDKTLEYFIAERN